MSSKFFRTASDDDSSSDSSDEDLYSSSENEFEFDKDGDDSDSDASSEAGSAAGSDDSDDDANQFLRGADDSSDSEESEDEDRVVKSAKDKRIDELESIVRSIENAQKINDWAAIASEFDRLNRAVAKLIVASRAPKAYIRAVSELEDFMSETIAKQKVTPKKMNATSAKGLNAVKQRIKKNNKEYQTQIDAYRADKEAFMSSDSDEKNIPKAFTPKNVIKESSFVRSTEEVEEDDDAGFTQIGKGGKSVQYSSESILKHLRTITDSRGKKNTDKPEQIRTMEKLLEVSTTPYQTFRILLALVATRFDLASGSHPISVEQWNSVLKELNLVLETLDKHRDHVVHEAAEGWDDDEKLPTVSAETGVLAIPGSLVAFVERLDDELTRSLRDLDPHTSEYIDRLSDEGAIYQLLFRSQLYYERIQKENKVQVPQESLNLLTIRRLEHIYYKPAQVVKIFEEKSWEAVGETIDSTITPRAQVAEPHDLVSTLCAYVFANSEGILSARAMLAQIYYLALHDEYYRARDMSLMSHLQDSIPNFDVATQILYNRALVQVGLCAFRKGLVHDTQTTLQDICGSGRQKELLAQGIMMQRFQQVTPEQERLEKQRQLPFHMHINLELLECIYLTCSMLLEIPLMAQVGSSPDVRKRVISKSYRRLLEHHERQVFTGPPENTRDHVMQASKALAAGDWKKAVQFIHDIKIWELIANPEGIKEMLAKQIQVEGLRTYLFTYAPFYNTLSLSLLSDMFDMPPSQIAAIVAKMVCHEELMASVDQANQTIVFQKGVELNRLQILSLSLADKASGLIESNERVLEQLTQGSSSAFDRTRTGGGRGGQRGGQRVGRGGARTGGNNQRQAGGTRFTGGALGVRG